MASEVLRSLEMRVARLERKASTSRRASKFGRSISGAIVKLQRKFPGVPESTIAEGVVNTIHSLYENLHDIIRGMEDEEYEEEYADLFPSLVRAGLLGKTLDDHNGSRKLRNSKEVNLFAEEMYDADDLARLSEDMVDSML